MLVLKWPGAGGGVSLSWWNVICFTLLVP
jgi:hypothetical protein